MYLDANNLYSYKTSNFLPTNAFKQIDPKEFEFNIYTNNGPKKCALEVDGDKAKELCELDNDYLQMKFSPNMN